MLFRLDLVMYWRLEVHLPLFQRNQIAPDPQTVRVKFKLPNRMNQLLQEQPLLTVLALRMLRADLPVVGQITVTHNWNPQELFPVAQNFNPQKLPPWVRLPRRRLHRSMMARGLLNHQIFLPKVFLKMFQL